MKKRKKQISNKNFSLFSSRLNEYFYPSAHSYRLRSVVNEIIRRFEGKTVLDVGMGSGWLMRDLYNAGFYPTGVDVSESSVKEAKFIFKKEKLPLKIYKTEAEKLPFKDRSFDNVVLFSVLEHIEHPQKSLREIRRVLRPNGVLAVVVPNPKTYGLIYDTVIPKISKKLELLNTIRLNDDYRKFSLPLHHSIDTHDFHTFRYNASSLRKTLEKSGFVIEHTQNSGFVSHFVASFFCGILGLSRKNLQGFEFVDINLAKHLPLSYGIGWIFIGRKKRDG